jgi:hypothetical protein
MHAGFLSFVVTAALAPGLVARFSSRWLVVIAADVGGLIDDGRIAVIKLPCTSTSRGARFGE